MNVNFSQEHSNKVQLSVMCSHRCVADCPHPLQRRVATKETAQNNYMLILENATWISAFSNCKSFGDGFHLANIEDSKELDLLGPWFTEAVKQGEIH